MVAIDGVNGGIYGLDSVEKCERRGSFGGGFGWRRRQNGLCLGGRAMVVCGGGFRWFLDCFGLEECEFEGGVVRFGRSTGGGGNELLAPVWWF